MSNFTLSHHATVRTTQRNVNNDALDIVLTYGFDVPAGALISKRSLRLSHLQEIYEDGFSVNVVEKALNLEVVVRNDGLVITCYKVDRTKHLRRKTRRFKCRDKNATIQRHKPNKWQKGMSKCRASIKL